MHRLLVTTASLSFERPVLSKEAMNHLKVIRPKDGEEIELFDGCGSTRKFYFSKSNQCLVAKGEITTVEARSLGLELFACITKGSRWDWTIEKATELGVTKIIPVISDRTIVRIAKEESEAKRNRWQRIAEDAARQSDAKWIPQILPAISFKDSLQEVVKTKCFVGALTNPPAKHLLEMALMSKDDKSKPLAIYIGPEGDFTSEELSQLLEVATPTSFGPTILRAETAAIFALSVLSSIG